MDMEEMMRTTDTYDIMIHEAVHDLDHRTFDPAH